MKRFAVFLAIFTFGALLPALPAAAQSGTASSGSASGQCTTGSTCQLQLKQWITFSGSVSQGGGGNGNPVDVTPPPCLWEPIGNATTGSQKIISDNGSDPSKVMNILGIPDSVRQANKLLKNPEPGEWYLLPINPNASPAGQAECLKLPLYAWVPAGQVPPEIQLPPQTLAQMAFSVLATPTVSNIETNPMGNSETNLPTFVTATLTPAAGQLLVSPDGRVYTWDTATLGNVSATVWIESTGTTLDITSGSPNATVYHDCNHAQTNNGGVTLGSGASDTQMAQTQANQAIDCGVTYHGPGAFTMQVTLNWTACWAPVGNAGGSPPPAGCAAVPGAGNLDPATANKAVNVQEIQSINGGG